MRNFRPAKCPKPPPAPTTTNQSPVFKSAFLTAWYNQRHPAKELRDSLYTRSLRHKVQVQRPWDQCLGAIWSNIWCQAHSIAENCHLHGASDLLSSCNVDLGLRYSTRIHDIRARRNGCRPRSHSQGLRWAKGWGQMPLHVLHLRDHPHEAI